MRGDTAAQRATRSSIRAEDLRERVDGGWASAGEAAPPGRNRRLQRGMARPAREMAARGAGRDGEAPGASWRTYGRCQADEREDKGSKPMKKQASFWMNGNL